jgi:hypothetical protein
MLMALADFNRHSIHAARWKDTIVQLLKEEAQHRKRGSHAHARPPRFRVLSYGLTSNTTSWSSYGPCLIPGTVEGLHGVGIRIIV